jgi:hypothetical protein
MGNFEKKSVTRRTVLIGAAAIATPLLVAGGAQAAGTLPQSSVNYQTSPKGADSCSKCKNFVAPSSCKSVAGTINPNGWCKLFNPKA